MIKGLARLAVLLLLVLGAPSVAHAQSPVQRMCTDYLGGRLTVEVLGDSIMAGGGATTAERAWPNVAHRTFAPGGGQVWNGAIGGSVTSEYLPGGVYYGHTNFTRVVKPSVVVLGWRINEQYRYEWGLPGGATPAQLTANVVSLVNHIREASPGTAFVVVNVPHPLGDWGYPAEQRYIEALWSAKEATGAMWLDVSHYFPQPGGDNGLGLMGPDGLHPGDPGQAVIATAVHQRIHATCT